MHGARATLPCSGRQDTLSGHAALPRHRRRSLVVCRGKTIGHAYTKDIAGQLVAASRHVDAAARWQDAASRNVHSTTELHDDAIWLPRRREMAPIRSRSREPACYLAVSMQLRKRRDDSVWCCRCCWSLFEHLPAVRDRLGLAAQFAALNYWREEVEEPAPKQMRSDLWLDEIHVKRAWCWPAVLVTF